MTERDKKAAGREGGNLFSQTKDKGNYDGDLDGKIPSLRGGGEESRWDTINVNHIVCFSLIIK